MKNNKSFIVKISIIIAVIILIIGLIWVGFAAVKMVDKWIGKQAEAETAKQVAGGLTNILPFSPFKK